ncbi:hypothetical protein Sjap_023591 [Stephania japonica]|uniref:Uncharacterized protein n=1 Tax=Stephania japonica TaxID=461633 RepID=A0AAP0EKD2_9MAGN
MRQVITLNTPLLRPLRELEIKGWPALLFLPRYLQHLTMIKSLCTRDFRNLMKLPEWLGNLASLERLWIRRTLLPSKGQMQKLKGVVCS